MVDAVLSQELITTSLMKMVFVDNNQGYEAHYLTPLFKKDKLPYLISLETRQEIGPNKVAYENEDYINSLAHEAKTSFTMAIEWEWRRGSYTHAKGDIIPYCYIMSEESDEKLKQYFNKFCIRYLQPKLKEKLPVEVRFIEDQGNIVFYIPFLKVVPCIHVNTILSDWDTAEEFIEHVGNSLVKNFVPAKNNHFFE